MKRVLNAAESRHVAVSLTTQEMPTESHLALTEALKVRGVLPAAWGVDCDRKPNDCSAGLRIDYCKSSVLFVGDTDLHGHKRQRHHQGSGRASAA